MIFDLYRACGILDLPPSPICESDSTTPLQRHLFYFDLSTTSTPVLASSFDNAIILGSLSHNMGVLDRSTWSTNIFASQPTQILLITVYDPWISDWETVFKLAY